MEPILSVKRNRHHKLVAKSKASNFVMLLCFITLFLVSDRVGKGGLDMVEPCTNWYSNRYWKRRYVVRNDTFNTVIVTNNIDEALDCYIKYKFLCYTGVSIIDRRKQYIFENSTWTKIDSVKRKELNKCVISLREQRMVIMPP